MSTSHEAGNAFSVERAPQEDSRKRAFARRVVEHLARHEAENNLPVGVASSVADGSLRKEVELLLAVDGSGRSSAALVMTPPYRVIVGHGDDRRALERLLEDMWERRVVPPGVVGPEPTAGEVARWWAERTGLEVRSSMRQGVYRLARVLPAPRTAGDVRVATREDAHFVLPWLSAFWTEAGLDVGDPEETFRSFLESDYRRLHVFEVEGRPVAIAGVGARTPRGRRIGPVYTPPDQRRNGYAEALVAEISAGVLASGNEFCFLFTDLGNATANAVYERIGYEMVTESAEYDLVTAG